MYDFRTLSPLDFEELVRDLLQAEFGLLLRALDRDVTLVSTFVSRVHEVAR